MDLDNCTVTCPAVVGCGEGGSIAIMVHVGIKAGERGDGL